MKRIAMITAGVLPVPSVEGGAVEALATTLLNNNEKEKNFFFDVYTIASSQLDSIHYENTNIIQIKPRLIGTIEKYVKKFNLERFGISVNAGESYIDALCKMLVNCQKKYDYILVENSAEIYVMLYKRIGANNNFIFHMHGCNYERDYVEFIGKTAIECLVVSQSVEKYVKGIFGNARTKVFYNCTNLEHYDSQMKEIWKDKIRKKYDISKETLVILYVGRLVPDKGIYVLYDAFMQIKEKYSNVVLVFAGHAGYGNHILLSEIEEKVRAEDEISSGRVIFTGYIEPLDMPMIYAAGDIMVIPSLLEEPFGVVVIEAMAMGIPMIVTRSGGIPEIVNKDCAVVVDKDEKLVENIAKALSELIESDSMRKNMGFEAIKRVYSKKEFDSKYYLKNFSRLLGESGNDE